MQVRCRMKSWIVEQYAYKVYKHSKAIKFSGSRDERERGCLTQWNLD